MTTLDAHAAFAGLIGCARADITPPAGINARMWGAAAHDVASGVHRPLTCTALALRARDAAPLVLLSLDLGWWKDASDERHVRDAVIDALGVDESRVVVALTHTHAGPQLCRADAALPGGELIAPYVDRVRDAAVDCARRALAAARPATLAWERGECGLARQRDLPDPAKPRMLCGFNPDESNDRTLLVGRAVGDDGAAIATILNYACHPTTLAWQNRLISPDWPGAAREVVEDATGALCLVLQGASGDLGPRDQYLGDPAVADANGRQVGYAALAVLAGMHPAGSALAYVGAVESGAPLATWERRPHAADRTLAARRIAIDLPLKDLPSAAEIERRLAACADRVQGERLRRALAVRRAVGDGPDSPQPAWIWRLGGAFLVAQPNEGYSAMQVDLRARLPRAPIAVLNLANGGGAGYLPPRAAYAGPDRYQVWQTPFAAGSMERVVDACAAAIAALVGAAGAAA